jgi:hypothetical protein
VSPTPDQSEGSSRPLPFFAELLLGHWFQEGFTQIPQVEGVSQNAVLSPRFKLTGA